MAIYRDLTFERFGDMKLIGDDLESTNYDVDFLYQNIIDRLITNHGDYLLYEELGANLSSFIGRIINPDLEQRIINSIQETLTYDGLVPTSLLQVEAIQDKYNILITIEVGQQSLHISERLVINSAFNTESGLFYVIN